MQLSSKGIKLFIANMSLAILSWPHFLSFQRAIANVEKTQRDVLFRIINSNASTSFGKQHNYNAIKSVDGFRLQVSLSMYEDYVDAISSIASGKKNVLTAGPVLNLEPSSGSTANSKFIPYTESLREEFKQGLLPWLFDLYRSNKDMLFGSSYWAISPSSSKEFPGSKIPIGFGDDASYFGNLEQKIIAKILAVPPIVSKIEDVDAFRYVTLLFLLRDENLSFVSIWNPTFLVLLLQSISDWMPQLLQDIKDGTLNPPSSIKIDLKNQLSKKMYPNKKRARSIENAWGKSNFLQIVWPKLNLISCWADGHAKICIDDLKILFPHVKIQPKGLIATEGMISFPLASKQGGVLSIKSHFFEFIEINDSDNVNDKKIIKLAHELIEGNKYSVIITTSGGLYRYQLQDIIQVMGFEKQCPIIQFISKESKVSDLVGEKLNEFHVSLVLHEVLNKYGVTPAFLLLAPEKNAAGAFFYCLFLELKECEKLTEQTISSLINDVEQKLEENYHYLHAVRLGQLLPAKLFIITENGKASTIYLNECRKGGQMLGQVKPAILSSKSSWSNLFQCKNLGAAKKVSPHN